MPGEYAFPKSKPSWSHAFSAANATECTEIIHIRAEFNPELSQISVSKASGSENDRLAAQSAELRITNYKFIIVVFPSEIIKICGGSPLYNL